MNTSSPARSRLRLAAAPLAIAGLSFGLVACGDDDNEPDDTEIDVETSDVSVTSVVTVDSEVTTDTVLTSEVEVTEIETDVSEVEITEADG